MLRIYLNQQLVKLENTNQLEFHVHTLVNLVFPTFLPEAIYRNWSSRLKKRSEDIFPISFWDVLFKIGATVRVVTR